MSDPITLPILANRTPTADQIQAAFRVAIVSAGSIAGALGYAGVFTDDRVNALNAMAGPVAAMAAFIWGQLVTRAKAKKLAVAASAAPDHIAQVKP